MVRWLRERGLDADAFATEFGDEAADESVLAATYDEEATHSKREAADDDHAE